MKLYKTEARILSLSTVLHVQVIRSPHQRADMRRRFVAQSGRMSQLICGKAYPDTHSYFQVNSQSVYMHHRIIWAS